MSALSNSRSIQTVSISDPRPYGNNPLTYPRKQLRKIDALIRRHGQIPTILLGPDMTIVSGEEWWLALKAAGKTEVKVEILADLSPAEANTVRLAVARLPLDAKLDPNRLRAEFSALQAQGIDLSLSCYDEPDIEVSLEIDMPRANVTDNVDDIPERQDRAVSKQGDIFQLGVHGVGCGDARDQPFVDRLREGREADACIVDFPYNLKFSKFSFGKRRYRQGDFVEASGEMSDVEFYGLLYDSLRVLHSASAASALVYAFMDWRHILELTAAGKQLGLPLLNICVWAKGNGGLGGL